MKQLLVFALLCISAVAFGQLSKDIRFKEVSHNFGKIKHNEPVTYVFSFKNGGTKPVIVESATAECGCTEPVFVKSPVGKGKESTIKVTFKANTLGSFTKKVTVRFAKIADPVVLTITGDVVAATN
jgi:hypothetical protein